MGLDSLLGSYGSDDEEEASAAPRPSAAPALHQPVKAAPLEGGSLQAQSSLSFLLGRHGAPCDCEECEALLARFAGKSLQTKGIRFRCKLCGHLAATKAAASAHFQGDHAAELQAFKRQKHPALFTSTNERASSSKPAVAKISFARDDILRKRPADDASSFGGWAKKEKPEPPPCDMPENQAAAAAEPVITAPPWMNQARPSNEDATVIDKEVDKHISDAQMRRFSKRNVLEVNSSTVRCKLCYKTLGSTLETERHIVETHREDFQKELQVWERFLFTSCRRQPPFGWVCKVCNTFFPSDGAAWRHLGKEVYIRHEERHLDAWHQKEDRWGHEEDEECCGDGINYARGFSYDSVKQFNDEAKKMQESVAELEEADRRKFGVMKTSSMDEEDEDEEEAEEPEVGRVELVHEF